MTSSSSPGKRVRVALFCVAPSRVSTHSKAPLGNSPSVQINYLSRCSWRESASWEKPSSDLMTLAMIAWRIVHLQVRFPAAAALPHPRHHHDDGLRPHLPGALPRHQAGALQQEKQPRYKNKSPRRVGKTPPWISPLTFSHSADRQASTGSIKPGDSDGCYLQPSKRQSVAGGPGNKLAIGRVTSSKANLMAKKRVIRMLLVIVFLFFLCWTPIFVVNAWQALDQRSAYRLTGAPISFIHLLSYTSACVNPIIYCFMNKRFRQEMLATFTCCVCLRRNDSAESAGIGMIGGKTSRAREVRKPAGQNGHNPASGANTRFTYTGVRVWSWIGSTWTDACTETRERTRERWCLTGVRLYDWIVDTGSVTQGGRK